MPEPGAKPAKKSKKGTFGSEKEHDGRTEIFVTRSIEKGPRVISETEDNSLLAVHRFATVPANVGVKMGLTLNLGNFEMARLDVEVSMPCYQEEIDETYRYAQSWVKSRLQTEVNELREHYPAKPRKKTVEDKVATKSNGAVEVQHPF